MNPEPRPERSDVQLCAIAVRDSQGAEGRAAASELLERHQRRVYLWCHRYVRNHDRALDLAQEVLMTAYRSLARFEGRSQFSSWLFVIARNKCLNAIAADRMDSAEPEWFDRLSHPGAGPEAEFEQQQTIERLRRAMMEHLDETERSALWMQLVSHMPVEAITTALNLDNATGARGLLQRARRRLRAAYAGDDARMEP